MHWQGMSMNYQEVSGWGVCLCLCVCMCSIFLCLSFSVENRASGTMKAEMMMMFQWCFHAPCSIPFRVLIAALAVVSCSLLCVCFCCCCCVVELPRGIIAIGVFIIIISLLGCFSAWKESRVFLGVVTTIDKDTDTDKTKQDNKQHIKQHTHETGRDCTTANTKNEDTDTDEDTLVTPARRVIQQRLRVRVRVQLWMWLWLRPCVRLNDNTVCRCIAFDCIVFVCGVMCWFHVLTRRLWCLCVLCYVLCSVFFLLTDLYHHLICCWYCCLFI